ncbi:hypothetical protein CALVIDRAFT_555248 [Calocera viscosa TUFC12733]|uniref:Uncharacterized protein n=1 Tax=Calocera viscosa (strain TUFC12733) TaxID=1330018 RepID=A0A167LXM5_CALVF|nr:hypothetical protein CALVIDRAFT_555248 [Calocera viscosa TUFC12733]
MDGAATSALFAGKWDYLWTGVSNTYLQQGSTNRWFKPQSRPPVEQVGTLAQRLRLQVPVNRVLDTSMSEADGAELPSYAEAAICPVQTIINMEARTPSIESATTSSVPPPYDPSATSSNPKPASAGQPTPAGSGSASRISSNLQISTLSQGKSLVATTVQPPAEQGLSSGLKSRLASSIRLSSLAQGQDSATPTAATAANTPAS